MINIRILILASLVISGLGGFFFYRYGVVKYETGYKQCQLDGAILATEAGKQLNETLHKYIKPDDVMYKLSDGGWLRQNSDR